MGRQDVQEHVLLIVLENIINNRSFLAQGCAVLVDGIVVRRRIKAKAVKIFYLKTCSVPLYP